jgi:hypothetical protein
MGLLSYVLPAGPGYFCASTILVAVVTSDHIIARVALDTIVEFYSLGCPADVIDHDVV